MPVRDDESWSQSGLPPVEGETDAVVVVVVDVELAVEPFVHAARIAPSAGTASAARPASRRNRLRSMGSRAAAIPATVPQPTAKLGV